MPKKERQGLLGKLLEENPFLTDEDLSRHFHVSVQTIRLDRLECGIPELRERLKNVASRTMTGEVKSLHTDEVIGDIIDLKLDDSALSIFDVTERSRISAKRYCARASSYLLKQTHLLLRLWMTNLH